MARSLTTLIERWRREHDGIESWDAYVARRARALVQNRRWAWLHGAVWVRDKGVCQCCGRSDEEYMNGWELGHIVDRALGGKDELSNLLIMCIVCNRKKPLHYTVEEFEEWRQAGGWWGSFVRYAGDEVWLAAYGITAQEAMYTDIELPMIDYSKLDCLSEAL